MARGDPSGLGLDASRSFVGMFEVAHRRLHADSLRNHREIARIVVGYFMDSLRSSVFRHQ